MQTLTDTASALTMPPITVGGTDLTTIADPVTTGQAAWTRIKAASKMLREDWRAVGEALLVGRRLHKSDKLFGQWCREQGFDMHRNVRGDAIWLAENWTTAQALCSSDAGHPTHIRAAYNAALAGDAAKDDETDDTEPATIAPPARPAALPSPTKPVQAPPAPRPQPTPPEPPKPAKYP